MQGLGGKVRLVLAALLSLYAAVQMGTWGLKLAREGRAEADRTAARLEEDRTSARLRIDDAYRRYLRAFRAIRLEGLADPKDSLDLMQGLEEGLVNRLDLYEETTQNGERALQPLASRTREGAPPAEIPRTAVPEADPEWAVGHQGAILVCLAAEGGGRLLVARLDPSYTTRLLDTGFPGLEHTPATIDPVLTVFPGPDVLPWNRIRVKADAVPAIREEAKRALRGFASGAGILWAALTAGLLLLALTVRRSS